MDDRCPIEPDFRACDSPCKESPLFHPDIQPERDGIHAYCEAEDDTPSGNADIAVGGVVGAKYLNCAKRLYGIDQNLSNVGMSRQTLQMRQHLLVRLGS